MLQHTEMVALRNTRLAVRSSAFSGHRGEHPDLVWGHCLMGCMAQDEDAGLVDWQRLKQQVNTWRYDVRGHGESAASRHPEQFQFSELTQDLAAVTTRWQLQRFALGGVSLGSALALHLALLQPERVSALVLMAPPCAWEMRRKQAALYRNIAQAVRFGALLPIQLMHLARRAQTRGAVSHDGFSAGALAAAPASHLARSTIKHLAKADRRSAVAAFKGAALSDLPAPEQIRSITIPTLILSWRDDTSHPIVTAERLHSLLPNSELHLAGSLAEVRQWTPMMAAFVQRHR